MVATISKVATIEAINKVETIGGAMIVAIKPIRIEEDMTPIRIEEDIRITIVAEAEAAAAVDVAIRLKLIIKTHFIIFFFHFIIY